MSVQSNWNSHGSTQIGSQAQGQYAPGNVQVITMDWRDILGAAQGQRGGAISSSTSPFILPAGQGSPTLAGCYAGKGIRQEVNGQQPATFRITVGNPGNLGQFHGQVHGGQPMESAECENRGSAVSSQPRVLLLPDEVNGQMYQPCGNCQACEFKKKGMGKVSQNFICRTSPQ